MTTNVEIAQEIPLLVTLVPTQPETLATLVNVNPDFTMTDPPLNVNPVCTLVKTVLMLTLVLLV